MSIMVLGTRNRESEALVKSMGLVLRTEVSRTDVGAFRSVSQVCVKWDVGLTLRDAVAVGLLYTIDRMRL